MKLLDVGNASNSESWQRIGRCQASCHVTFKQQRHTQLPSGSIDIIIITITIIMVHDSFNTFSIIVTLLGTWEYHTPKFVLAFV